MSVQIIRGDARSLPLADSSVDLVISSPPYWSLRSYQDNGQHYDGQLGSEATHKEFVDGLIDATREMVRVLKDTGSIWINLGDKYNAYNGNRGNGTIQKNDPRQTVAAGAGLDVKDIRPKSLIGVPWRYALRCIDDLGLILRAEVIWSKPNGLPESVTDRVRRSHETWFHFVKQPRYFSAVDEIRETAIGGQSGLAATFKRPKPSHDLVPGQGFTQHRADRPDVPAANPLGKLPGSVWTIPTRRPSVARSVLDAVAAGALTPDEGERILCATPESTSCPTSRSLTAAGNGPATETPSPDTGRSASSGKVAKTSPTASPTDSLSDLSLTDSRSITSAVIAGASVPTTSSQSPSARTSAEPIPSGPCANSDTQWPTHTLKSLLLDIPTSGAASAPARSSDDSDSSVWVVPTQPLKVPAELGIDHFAAFPFEFPRRIIRGWSPAGICTACGEGRRPVAERNRVVLSGNFGHDNAGHGSDGRSGGRAQTTAMITGYECKCPPFGEPAPTRPAVVLDPFGGTGTTALVADVLGRDAISVDMSQDYSRLAQWRTTDPGQRAAAAQVEKVEPVPEGQLDLFGDDAA